MSPTGGFEQWAVHALASSAHEPHSTRESRHAHHHGRHDDGDSVPLEEAFSPCTVMLRTRGICPVQSRRNKVGVSFGRISRGEKLNVRRGRVGCGVVGEVAVV